MKTIVYTLMFFAFGIVTSQQLPSIFPYPKMYFAEQSSGAIPSNFSAIVNCSQKNLSQYTQRLQNIIKKVKGQDVPISSLQSQYPNFAVYVGLTTDNNIQQLFPTLKAHSIESLKNSGYYISIRSEAIVIIGQNEEGLGTAIQTFHQLIATQNSLTPTFIWDYPDYPERWIFSQHNLRGAGAVKTIQSLTDTIEKYRLNGFSNHDFKLNRLPYEIPIYFRNIDTIVNYWKERFVKPIPGVANFGWSEGLLSNNPHLAEGVLTRVRCVVEGDSLHIVPISSVSIPNGGFENVGGNGDFTGWSFYDGAGVSSFRDLSEKHSGVSSARCTNFIAGNSAGNCRFSRQIQCEPHRQYVMSVWFKTENYKGDEVRLLALSGSRSLTYTAFSIPATTQGWQKLEVVFNTLENTQMNIYAGVWGGREGTIWFDDFEIRDAGFMNILRRKGTPVTLRNLTKSTIPKEGIDLDSILDPFITANLGNYGPSHFVRSPRLKPNSSITNGDSIFVEYFHPFTAVSDNQYSGSTMVCVSEPEVEMILQDQFQRVDSLFHSPDWFFFQHDEIRNMNRDSACLRTNKSPAELLSDNINLCSNLRQSVKENGRSVIWSDMIDSLHNARNNYYLINGDLRGIWNLVDPKPVIMNWNGSLKKESSDKFEEMGFKQIASAYYDVGSTTSIRDWRMVMETNDSYEGAMYTTWNGDYRFLRQFSYYVWGAGPNFQQPDVDVCSSNGDLSASVQVLADPFDSKDSITAVSIVVFNAKISSEFPLTKNSTTQYQISKQQFRTDPLWDGTTINYYFKATNQQGITNLSCVFEACPIATSAQENPSFLPIITVRNETMTVQSSVAADVKIVDILGRTILNFQHDGIGEKRVSIKDVQFGTYLAVFSTTNGMVSAIPFVHR
jgi:hypothetical protein